MPDISIQTRNIDAVVQSAGNSDAAYARTNERISEIEEKLSQNVDTQRVWQAHHPMTDAVNSDGNLETDIAIGKDFASGDKITPSVVVVSRIEENNGSESPVGTEFANIYSYIEQTGNDSEKYPKAIAGVTVNASGGDNDSSGVVGYSCKLDIPENGSQKAGIGDAVGVGGSAYQYSSQKGLVMGGEFSVHQNVSGTTASPVATANNQSIGLHITTKSTQSRVWSGISIDAQDTVTANSSTHYGYWNAITILRSCFAQCGEGYVPGTVGISMANCKKQYPDKAIYLGNANYHLYRSNNMAIRSLCSSFDISSGDSHSAGLRLVAKKGEISYSCYKNGNTKYYTAPNPSVASDVYLYDGTTLTAQNLEITEADTDETIGEYIKISDVIYSRSTADDISIDIPPAESSYIGFYDGQLGADRTTNLTKRAVITNTVGNNNQLYFRVYDEQGQNYIGLSLSRDANCLRPLYNNQMSLGHASYKWSNIYCNTDVISTSDRNQKEEIEDIDERLFKAWSKVNYKVFKFKDGKRKHFGLIAQEVDQAFQSEGLNARDYGLFCEDKDEDGNTYLGLRYSECLALECAYLRHKIEGV